MAGYTFRAAMGGNEKPVTAFPAQDEIPTARVDATILGDEVRYQREPWS